MQYKKLLAIGAVLTIIFFNFSTAFCKDLSGAVIDMTQKVETVKDTSVNQDEEIDPNEIADPLYYFNWVNFQFNDKLQNYVLEPTAKGYKYVTPEVARVGIGNFFTNLRAPVNIINNSFQLNFGDSALELLRFTINLTIGIGGFYDASNELFGIGKKEANFGQTLGYYGIGHGIYIVWPILGPSSLRETVGYAGDQMMSPSTYAGAFYLDFPVSAGVVAIDKVNDTSFKLGYYEKMTSGGLDPYDELQISFVQYTRNKVKIAKER